MNMTAEELKPAAVEAGHEAMTQELPADTAVPAISIIVPVYHVEKYLRRALDSLLRQTFTDFELILINDGGSEEEAAICREYAEKDSRIVYLSQMNQGVSAARNRGLDVHRGKWIMFADSDDWVRNDFCERALASVLASDADMGIFDLVYTESDHTAGHVHQVKLPEGLYDSDTILKARLCGKVQCFVWNKIYREDLWDDIRFPPGEYWEDDAVIHEVIDKAEKIAVIHDILYYKPRRKDSITSAAAENREAAYWQFIQRRRRWEYLQQNHPELLSMAADDMVISTIKYGRDCVLYNDDSEGFEKIRRWAETAHIPRKEVKLQHRIRYTLLICSKPLFGLMERIVRFMIKQKQSAEKRT